MVKYEEGVPKSVQEFYSRGDKIKEMIDLSEQMHSAVYLDARRKLKAHTGEAGLQNLESKENQEFLIDALVDSYISHIADNQGREAPTDAFKKEVFLQQQTGITKSALGGYIRSAKSDYTLSRHEQVRKTFVDKQRNELAATKTSHMTDSDLDDILRHTKTDKMFNRDLLNTQLGGIILDVYRSNGVFDYGTIDQIAQSTKGETDFNQYLTADAKKQKKDMVNNYAMSR